MNKLALTVAFTLHLVVFAKSASLPSNDTMFDVLAAFQAESGYKCTHLRSIMLNTTRFDFLRDCPGTLKLKGNSDMLCVLFYNNFLRLCNHDQDKLAFGVKTLLNESTVKASLENSDVRLVCRDLTTVEPINQSLIDMLAHIVKYMNESCMALCVDFRNNTVFPICTLSGLMNNVIKQLSKAPALVKSEHKQEDDKPVPKAQPQQESPKKNNETQHIETKSIKLKQPVEEVKQQAAPPASKIEQVNSKVKTDTKEVTEAPKEPPKAIVPEEKSKKLPVKDEKPPNAPVKQAEPVDSEGDVEKTDENAVNDKDLIIGSQENQYELEDGMPIPKNEEVEEPPSKKVVNTKPKEVKEEDIVPANANSSTQIEEEDSFFFVYFMMVCAVFILGYIGYHNKQKVLALVIEGRRGRRTSRRGSRPNSANYHKLDSNLEEAVTSSVHKNTTSIIY